MIPDAFTFEAEVHNFRAVLYMLKKVVGLGKCSKAQLVMQVRQSE